MRRAAVSVPAVLVALAATACGSTVQTTAGGAGALPPPSGGDGLSLQGGTPGAGPGTGLDGAAGSSSAGDGTGTGASAGTGSGSTGARGTGPGSGAPGPAIVADPGSPSGPSAGTTSAGSGEALGPGVDAKTIKVGVTYVANGEAANSAIGGGGIDSSDGKANAKAVIDEINARGGVAGRKLVGVYVAYDATSSDTPAFQDERACNALTRDDKVLAVTSSGLTEVFPACMQKAGVTILDSGKLIAQDAQLLRTFPSLLQLGTLVQDRMMQEMVRSLQRQQYFTGWNNTTGSANPASPVKVGVLTLDSPEWIRPLNSVLLPSLKTAGYSVAKEDVQRIPKASTTSDVGRQAQAVGSAVLRLRSDGVTHLVMLDASGTITIFFAQAAKNQGYYPRLGVNSATGMQALTDAGVGGNDIFEGAVGLGWFPNIDLPRSEAAKRQGPATKDCLAVIKKRTGQDLSAGNGASIALAGCDSLFFLKTVGDRAGTRLNQSGLVATAEGLGTAFSAALYGKTRFAPGRHDALETGYDMAWSTDCTCATYKRSFDIP